jgi:hypothetical protein
MKRLTYPFPHYIQKMDSTRQRHLYFDIASSSNPRAKYLSMKEGSLFLFCIYEIHCTGMLQVMLLVSLESSRRGGVHGLGSMAFLLRPKFGVEKHSLLTNVCMPY